MGASDVLPVAGSLAQVGAAVSAQRLAVAWQHPETRSIQPVGILQLEGHVYSYYYIRAVQEVADFLPFIGFPDLYGRYESDYLFPIFAQRVMDPRRPDYVRFIDSLDLAHEASPWEQLARSEGRRAGDTILLFPEPTVNVDGSTSSTFLVHGIRHVTQSGLMEERLRRVRQGDRLLLKAEPANPVNSEAILIATGDGEILGWVPDLLLDYVRNVQAQGDHAVRVVQVNGPDAPMHMRLLVRLSGRVPAGYRTFTGPPWEPLAR